MLRLLMVCFLSLWSAQSWAQSPFVTARIGLFPGIDDEACNLEIPTGETREFYVVLDVFELNVEVVNSVLFRIDGLPDEWIVSAQPHFPFFGDIFDDGVGVIAQLEMGRHVLFTVTITATSELSAVRLVPERLVPPISPFDPACPGVGVSCGGACDIFQIQCVDTASLSINSIDDCTLPIAEHSWLGVKTLYK